MAKLVVIGGVAAGMSAAAKARRTNPDLEIVVYTDELHVSYGACGLPYYIAGEIKKSTQLIARKVEQFAEAGIKVHTGCRVEEIQPEVRLIQVRNLESGELTEVSFDQLVIATGAAALMPPIEGRGLKGVFKLRNVVDGEMIRGYLEESKPQTAVIVGGGLIGLEMAESLYQYGIKVTIVEMSPHLVVNMDKDMAEILEQYLVSKGIEVLTGEKVLAIEGENKRSSVEAAKEAKLQAVSARVQQVVTDRRRIPADFVLLTVGVVPNSQLAEKAGIQLGVQKAIRVNQRMETNKPGIYAAGD
jgi:NADPH-dependent 2,4-dienoyl-CoA reductase/sulfur reductase-like enzyme